MHPLITWRDLIPRNPPSNPAMSCRSPFNEVVFRRHRRRRRFLLVIQPYSNCVTDPYALYVNPSIHLPFVESTNLRYFYAVVCVYLSQSMYVGR